MKWRYLLLFSVALVCCSTRQLVNASTIIRMSQDSEDDVPHDLGIKENAGVKFSFAKHFQDNMVLQRAPKKARVNGFSPEIGAKVDAKMTVGQKYFYYSTSVVQGPESGVGVWTIELDPMNVTDPVIIHFISHAGTITLTNVLFGDVWLCSGQSNMQFTVSQMLNGAQEAFDAKNYPNIRLFTAALEKSDRPLYDLVTVEESWTSPSSGAVSAGAWKHFSAVCWVFGKNLHQSLGYPVGLVATDWGGTPVEAWSSPDALKKCNVTLQKKQPSSDGLHLNKMAVGGPQENSVLWNAMVNPFLGMTFYGAIWYQGEADVDNPEMRNRYNCTFPAMIDDWRDKFSQASQGQTSSQFPFGFVQLAPYRATPNPASGFPDIRWHQTADYGHVPNPRMPNTFMAVSMDLPDFESPYSGIHPRDKEDVGIRLALSGLAVGYNRTVGVFEGPYANKGYFKTPTTLILDYGNKWTLKVINRNGFEFACANPSGVKWVAIPIIAFSATTLTFDNIGCKQGEELYSFRYAWRESPCGFKDCAVYSTVNSLPASPFVAYFKGRQDGAVTLEL